MALLVGNLAANTTDAQLRAKFQEYGSVLSVRICVDSTTRRSLGYGYVNYSDPAHAAAAIEHLNNEMFLDKPLRISYSQRDPSIRPYMIHILIFYHNQMIIMSIYHFEPIHIK